MSLTFHRSFSTPSPSMWQRLAVVLTMALLWCVSGLAMAQGGNVKFDHLKTGFPLSGAHTTVRCESCHIGGVFKGTPKDCRSCHSPGSKQSQNSVQLPGKHIPTTLTCETCHGTQSFSAVNFSHAKGISPGQSCVSCHDGARAQGKGPNHMATKASCDSCHNTNAWEGGKPPHDTFNTSTNCASCHNGSRATGKAASHIPVSANCISCHAVSTWKPTKFNHTQVAVNGACSTCHSGGFAPADGKPAKHIPYTALSGVNIGNCDSCHKGGFNSWGTGQFHSNVKVSNQCASCHLSAAFGTTGKPADPIHSGVTGNCESCHTSTAAWSGGASGVKVDHSAFTASTNCSSCHNGATATGKGAAHIPTQASCFSCHATTGWTPTKFNHTQVTVKGVCSTCHTGKSPPADGKPGNHIPYATVTASTSANCDTCHKGGYTSWNPGKFHTNVTTTTQCASCHLSTAYGLTAKPNNGTHTGVTGNCESCHKSAASWTSGTKVDHSTFTSATNCATCHNGGSATGKAANHIPTTVNCFSCHSTTTWTPSKWNHTQSVVAGTCSTCHSGAYAPADGKPANHIPYAAIGASASANCDSCHKGGYSSWATGKFHSSYTVSTQCATCHMSSSYGQTPKPANALHSTVTGNCESCHKNTTDWASGAKVDHSTFTSATNCATCHNGSSATGKTSRHIPTTASCFSCHSTTAWVPSKWNHTQATVANACSTCHSGNHSPADGKPGNHIPYATVTASASANCDTCHKGVYTSWATGKFHTNVSTSTQCASCHLSTAFGQTPKPANTLHSTVTGNCESCHKSTVDWTSGTRVDHSTFTAATNCAGCHNGNSASGKPLNHIPYASVGVSAAANCYTCHKSTSTWTTGKYHSNFTLTGQCNTCHNANTYGQVIKPSNHIPLAQLLNGTSLDCSACHKSTAAGGFATATMNHNNSQGSGSGSCKACHLSGTAYLGNMEKKGTNHLAGKVDCSTSGCHRPLGNRGTAYRNWD